MEDKRSLQSIPDDELLHCLAEVMSQSRRVEADVVAHIAEVDERRLYAREAFPSMFVYCTDALHLSEAEAYLRISVARASRRHPILLIMLADGRLHLSAIVKLMPHLTGENQDELLERATHRSKRQLDELIALIAPRPDAPAVVRRLPVRRTRPTPRLVDEPRVERLPRELRPDGVAPPEPGAQAEEGAVSPKALSTGDHAAARNASTVAASPSASTPPVSPLVLASPVSPAVMQPLSPGRYKVQFTASAEFHHKLERLQALMGSRAANGDLAAVIEQAVTEKLERLEARRFARTRAPRKGLAETETAEPDLSPSSRHIPAAVRRAVRGRDGDRCRYVDEQGRRCPERNRLEFHHRHPFGLGGGHSPSNVGLVCRAHNAYLADRDYGREAMARHRSRRSRPPAKAAG